jgi:hypothetical protein
VLALICKKEDLDDFKDQMEEEDFDLAHAQKYQQGAVAGG